MCWKKKTSINNVNFIETAKLHSINSLGHVCAFFWMFSWRVHCHFFCRHTLLQPARSIRRTFSANSLMALMQCMQSQCIDYRIKCKWSCQIFFARRNKLNCICKKWSPLTASTSSFAAICVCKFLNKFIILYLNCMRWRAVVPQLYTYTRTANYVPSGWVLSMNLLSVQCCCWWSINT